MDSGFLRGKLAKRVFVLFVASALIPIMMLAALYEFQGSTLLLEHAQGRLRGATSTYGTAIYDRLVLADEALRKISNELDRGLSLEALRISADATLSDLRLIPFDAKNKTLRDAGAMEQLRFRHIFQALSLGQTALITRPGHNRQSDVFMARLIDPARPGKGAVSAQIRPQYLWAERDSNPYLTELCVVDHGFSPLSCTQAFEVPGLPAALAAQANSVSGDIEWSHESQSYVSNFREIFLEAKFTIPRWIVVASQRKMDALDSLKDFKTIFWASLAVSTLLALLLSSMQIRRTMVPLEKLIQGTSRLRSKDFSTRVEIQSNDEFGTLATSFNNMAQQLGRQFEVMTTLSAIDRAILYELDIDRLMEEVLLSLRMMYSLECAGIVVIDRDAHDRVRLYSLTADRDRPMAKHTHVGN
ncbi:MAG: HAMP domain-containing protein, partial [Burkholderiales bacterium]|nr:HAMP domain-containing protein [Burkholderiales bacterium]